jgi:nicotinate-nucleotide--dimethylbenzimidazole phosphoribosyltransferase
MTSLSEIFAAIESPDKSIQDAAQLKMDFKTKPQGSLGKLENLAIQLCSIQNSLKPEMNHQAVFVFAADHGVTEEGVSAFPAEVTVQMVYNFLQEGAAINVLCRQNGVDLKVVDAGVNGDFEPHENLIIRKIAKGTRNMLCEAAMSEAEALASLRYGREVFDEYLKEHSVNAVGFGEMGIGNTTAATAIICAVTGIDVEQSTGRGTGVDAKGLKKKITVIQKALEKHQPDPENPVEILKKVGGFEIAQMAGAMLAAAANRKAVVLDGLISTAAGLIAFLINPAVKDYMIASHRSVESAQTAALEMMGLTPLLDLNLRLGEGSGAALVMNLIRSATLIMNEMASFDIAGVTNKIEP